MKIKSLKAFALLCILLISNQVLSENKYQEKTIEIVNYEVQNNFNSSINNTINLNPDNLEAKDNLNKTITNEQVLEKPNKINEIVSVSKNSSISSINNRANNINGMKYHSFEINFFNSFFRSFSLLLISEVMDKSFIIILYFSTKLPPTKVLFFSGISLVFMNSISIIIGYSLPSLLYRTLIEWIALISFIFLSFAYVNEAYHLEDETHEKKITKTIKNEKRSRLLEKKTSLQNIKLTNVSHRMNTLPDNSEVSKNLLEKHQDEEIMKTEEKYFYPEYDENKLNDSEADENSNSDIEHKKIIYTLIYSILVAECGDRSQLSSILLATVYNFSGVMVGTTMALLCTIVLAVYLGSYISKYISEKTLNYIAGFIFLLFGLEILITKAGYF